MLVPEYKVNTTVLVNTSTCPNTPVYGRKRARLLKFN